MLNKISERIEQIIITKLIALFETPIDQLGAYKLGLINKDGVVIKQPKSRLEKRALSKTVLFALALRPFVLKTRILRDQPLADLRRKHALRSVYSAAIEDIELAEAVESISYTDLLKEYVSTSEKTINEEIEELNE